ASSTSSSGWFLCVQPALLTTMSSLPNRSTVALTNASMSARFVTSQVTAIALSPSDLATSLAPAALMSATATLAPSATYCLAISAPKPLAAPVTIATWSFNLILFSCGSTNRSSRGERHWPWYCTTVLTVQNSSRAMNPFSRPWPLFLTPPDGSSTPPPAP